MKGLDLTLIDYLALAIFVLCWLGYNLTLERSMGANSLNRIMDGYRSAWMRQSVIRENRIVDTALMATLHNGAAFFASTSFLAIGGAMALFRSTDDMLNIMSNFPFGELVTRQVWEIKVLGLTLIFIYTFFKFAWSYRIFTYSAILLGAIPVVKGATEDSPELRAANEVADRAARMNIVAGKHFNRGQRSFFFALAYLSWFISAYALILATIGVIFVMRRRQFSSAERKALQLP